MSTGEYWDGASGVTVTGLGASTWAPIVGTNSFLQGTDTNRPSYANGILTFDGTDNFMATAGFTLDQPVTVFVAFSQTTWAASDAVFDGIHGLGVGYAALVQNGGASPELVIFAGTGNIPVAGDANLATGTLGIAVCIFNGASSSLQVNLNAASTGDAGANNLGGFTLGANGDPGGYCACAISGFGYSTGALTAGQITQTVRAMGRRYGISV